MLKFLKNKHFTVWIACCAILLNALMPSIASAFTARAGMAAFQNEICSTAGASAGAKAAVLANKDTPPAAPDGAGGHSDKHCPFCLPHPGNFALPPPVLSYGAPLTGHDFYPPLFYRAPSPLFSWASSSPRGPPQLS